MYNQLINKYRFFDKRILIATSFAILLSLTPFYSIGYLVIISALAFSFSGFYIFTTHLQRFLLLLFTFIATVPLTGLVCWAINTPLQPLYNITLFLLVYILLYDRGSKTIQKNNFLDFADIIAIGVALSPVVIIIATYASAPNLTASLFQLVSEGWDNGSHILMLQDNTSEKGYVYGTYDELKDKIIQESNAYPQAWHLATADIVNGFGGDRFLPEQTTQTMFSYMVAVTMWMVCTSYFLILCMWRFYELITKKRIREAVEVAPIVATSSLVIIVVIVSALMHGFTNYIASLGYLILMSAMVIEFRINQNRIFYLLCIIFGIMSVLTWFLTLPAVGLIILSMISLKHSSVKASILSTLKDWRTTLFLTIGAIVMPFQLYIFQKFSSISSTSQINVGSLVEPFDVTGSPLHISHVLFGVIVATLFAYLIYQKTKLQTKQLIIITTFPWLALVIGVYLYQNITSGVNSYYLTKVVGLSLVAVIIPLGALVSTRLSRIDVTYPKVMIPVISFFIVIFTIYASGQPTYGINKLFQANARTTYSTAIKTVEHLPKTIKGEAYIVTLTGRKSYEGAREDHHGKLEIRVVHQPLNCTYGITGYISINTAVKRLAACADQPYMKNKTIYVLTSPETHEKVKALNKANIIIDIT